MPASIAAADTRISHYRILYPSKTRRIARCITAEQVLQPAVARKTDTEAAQLAAEGHLLRAAAAERSGDRRLAQSAREAALALVSPAVIRNRDSRTKALEARALLALGRVEEARPIVTQLLSNGYRHPSLLNDWRAQRGAATHQ
jgi:hypothetical protein